MLSHQNPTLSPPKNNLSSLHASLALKKQWPNNSTQTDIPHSMQKPSLHILFSIQITETLPHHYMNITTNCPITLLLISYNSPI